MKYEHIASDDVIAKVVENLKARNIHAVVVDTKEEALEEIKKLIPNGGSVMNGSSTTLNEIGFVDYLKEGNHGWDNVHADILNEKDKAKQTRLRKESVLADYFLGSVHAITEAGQLMIASASGSQIPSYAFTSDNVIWVASANKIVADREAGFKRIEDYVFPLENKRMQGAGYPGSTIGRVLVIEREIMPNRKLTLILVKEKLGF
ncbi:MAG TPA: lactate utilization protein [Candidatus Yonathbacteria bacterium]|nr:lactate utilization protein [Candidatus Yonathbacteria bacterium]